MTGEDRDFVIGPGEKKTVGPFRIRIPNDASRGRYHVLVGYREFPWEPLIEFKGTAWAPPEKIIKVR